MKRWQAHWSYWPTLGFNVLLGRVLKLRHWWDHVTDQVLLGARPFQGDVRALREMGVTGIVNMCEEWPGLVSQYAQAGIEQMFLPTVDFNHPRAADVDRGADFIQQHVTAGGKVYVHCKAGRARSATVVLWWLVKYRHMTPEQAQALLCRVRPHVNPRVYLRPVIQELVASQRSLASTAHPAGSGVPESAAQQAATEDEERSR